MTILDPQGHFLSVKKISDTEEFHFFQNLKVAKKPSFGILISISDIILG